MAEALVRAVGGGDAKVRFTTSGTLATMYAVMLAQGLTGRDLVLKVGGGWHGASPYLLKGVKYHGGEGFEGRESAGLLDDIVRRTLVTRFNDGDDLRRIVAENGDRIACFIVEPFLGVGGFLPASREYLALARRADGAARHPARLRRDHLRIPLLPGRAPDALRGPARPDDVRQDHRRRARGGRGHRAGPDHGGLRAGPRRPRPGHVRGRDVLLPLRIHAGRADHARPPRRPGRDGLPEAGPLRGEDPARDRARLRRPGHPGQMHGRRERRPAGELSLHGPFPAGDEQGFDRPEVLQDARRMDIGLREDLLKLALLVARRQRRPRRRGRSRPPTGRRSWRRRSRPTGKRPGSSRNICSDASDAAAARGSAARPRLEE
ncbi:MAG: aminotransferase class III-fold pyridoxal phosphate-dependent enzyme [Candidatus Moduliflexus flocculans]|nr:aminotransferase class III-fold pyridoxal phosphate-dependent enzyme [Candidatus Moduliflexus flocculans]